MHCDELFIPSCEATVWCGWSRVWGASVLAQMVWELWEIINGHLCSIYTSLLLAMCPARIDTFHWKMLGKWQETKSVGDPPLSHRLLGRQTQCSDQVLSFCRALFSFRATLLSPLSLVYIQSSLNMENCIQSLHVSLCVCLQPCCYHL